MADPEFDLSGMVVEVEQRFAEPPGAVWDLLADLPRMSAFSAEVVELHWEGAPGGTFSATNQLGSARWTVRGHVVEADRPRSFAWTVLDPERPSSTWSYALEPDGDGTLVRQRFAHGPGPSGVRALVGDDESAIASVVRVRGEMLRTAMTTSLSRAARALQSGG